MTSFFNNATAQFFGQSFTAPCDGQVSSLTVTVYSASTDTPSAMGTVNLIIVEGAGGTGTEVVSESIVIMSPAAPDTPETRVLTFTDAVPVSEDQTYTFFLLPEDGNTLQFIGTNTPTYAGGALYVAQGGDITTAVVGASATVPEFDLTFEIAFEQSATATEAGPSGAVISIGALQPNPAVSSTRVPFSLESLSDVRLSIYDVLGREVAVVAEGTFGAGDHTAHVDASALSAGTYIARLTSEQAVVSRTFTVVR